MAKPELGGNGIQEKQKVCSGRYKSYMRERENKSLGTPTFLSFPSPFFFPRDTLLFI